MSRPEDIALGSSLGHADKASLPPKRKRLPKGISEAVHTCVHWLYARGCSGALTQDSVLAAGDFSHHDPQTWIRARDLGLIRMTRGRAVVTGQGCEHCVQYPAEKEFHGPFGYGRVEPHPGADEQ